MGFRIQPIIALSVTSLALALVAVISLGVLATRRSVSDSEISRLLAVRDMVVEEYVEPVSQDDLARDAIRGMVESLDDYSRYSPGKKEVEQIEIETTGRFGGVGIVLVPDDNDYNEVLFPQPDSPAEKAGIQPGAKIIAVDGVLYERIRGEIGERIRGPEGTSVELTFQNEGDTEPTTATVRRTVLHEPSVRRARILDPERGIASLWISSFTEETTQQFDDAIASLKKQGMKSLILDLRFNGGGVLSSAAEIANRFVRSGIIYEQRGRKSDVRYTARPEAATSLGVPCVVLVNGDTASASEVLAGALSDHGAAAIVGQRTYGKGVVQSLKRFEDNGAYIKITTAYYFTPSGRNLERARETDREDRRAGGIAPDVVVENSAEERWRIVRFNSQYAVPGKYEAAVESRRAKRKLGSLEPSDTQMRAALALLRGERPPDRKLYFQ
jgi:carboxyl-terminal processing protease